MLVDVHCHLNFKEFDSDRDEIIKKAKSNNFTAIINSGTEYETNIQTLKLSEKYSLIKASLGIYPTYVEKLTEKEFQRDLDFIKENKSKIISIGEVGLDFHNTKEDELKQIQIKRFKKILLELNKLNKPFVIHSRKAEKECIDILEELNIKKVLFHCFTGRYKLAKRIEDNGWYFSIPPIITRSSHFQGMVKQTSINSMLTETDAPYLAPDKEQRNEPIYIKQTLKKIAEIKELTQQEVEKNIFFNYQKLFS